MARSRLIRLWLSAAWMAVPAMAAAQDAAAPADTVTGRNTASSAEVPEGEIIVTARKRAESDLAVPAVISVFDAEALTKNAATDIYKIAELTPNFIVSQSSGATGGIIALRGVASGTGNAADQAVAINIDGIAISNATALRIGQFDLQQVEVLKGPQALFFGKNSPGGVISFISAGPTSEWDGYVRSGYEFVADQWRTEAAVGGPLSDTIGVRLAGFYDEMKGYFRNPLPDGFAPGVVFDAPDRRVPNQSERGGRLTVAVDPTSALRAELKAAYVAIDGSASFAQNQVISCPTGVPAGPEQVPGNPVGNCTLDRIVNPVGSISPAVQALSPAFARKSGDSTDQIVSSLNVDYEITPELSLNSVTGWYDIKYRSVSQLSGPRTIIVQAPNFDKRDYSEELRLQSDFGGGFDFMVGGLYQDSFIDYHPSTFLAGNFLNSPRYKIDDITKSGFVQGTARFTDSLELALGVRYTDEVKKISVSQRLTGDRTAFLVPRRVASNDWSPEATLTYRPTTDLTLYGAYKEAFKSGGFVASATGNFNAPTDISYRPETVNGFEVGLKARLLDRQLRLNSAVYTYKYDDLQVSAFDPTRLTVTTVNAASAKVRGAEADFAFEPDTIDGLLIQGAVSYNRARYGDYIATCITGQTIAQGCNLLLNALNGRFTSQDLSGRQLAYAPDWAGNLGIDYELPVTGDTSFQFGGAVRYQSSYNADGTLAPEAVSRRVAFVDARARLFAADGRWEVALIGRNLTNKLRPVQANDVVLTGTPAGLPTGVRADEQSFVNRPREVMIQLTFRPFR